jgi:hypothetical protein
VTDHRPDATEVDRRIVRRGPVGPRRDGCEDRAGRRRRRETAAAATGKEASSQVATTSAPARRRTLSHRSPRCAGGRARGGGAARVAARTLVGGSRRGVRPAVALGWRGSTRRRPPRGTTRRRMSGGRRTTGPLRTEESDGQEEDKEGQGVDKDGQGLRKEAYGLVPTRLWSARKAGTGFMPSRTEASARPPAPPADRRDIPCRCSARPAS